MSTTIVTAIIAALNKPTHLIFVHISLIHLSFAYFHQNAKNMTE
nr:MULTISPECIES: hypothetical protein [unclassified Allomuricauda]|tara:strand:- start:6136 stop:6267 length:132 start_codon:yes stop_codon:yes gene_type:complete